MFASQNSTNLSSEQVLVDARRTHQVARRLRRDLVGTLGPLGLYAVLSVGLFGVPVLGHLGSHIIAVDQLDPGQLMWMLAWWPHALLHGLNPFITHAMLYPDGYNLTWATSMPLPSLVLAPITRGLGPAVSWNVLELLSPALSAWTAFLLCRHVVGRPLPALIGGYLFGFSPYILLHLEASPHNALVALLPVFVLLALRRIEGSISPRRFFVAITLALTAQSLISTEVLATSTLFGAFGLLAAFVLLKEHRQQLLQTAKLLVLAYVATAVLISPYLYYFVFGQHYPPGATSFSADLFSFVLPTRMVALRLQGGPQFVHAANLPDSSAESYLGLPLVALIVLFSWQRRHSRVSLLLVLCVLVAVVASLGERLEVLGHVTSAWMPWRLFAQLPALQYAIPERLIVFATLPAALIVAIWLDHSDRPDKRGAVRGRLASWGLALLAVVFIAPDVGSSTWNTPIADPPFFQHGAYRAYLSSRDHVLTIPFWGPSQRWVADTGFPFTLSAGAGGQGQDPGYTRYPIWRTLIAYPFPLPADYGAELRRFLTAKDVTAIVVEQGSPGPWKTLFGTLGVQPVATGGVLLYRLARPRAGST